MTEKKFNFNEGIAELETIVSVLEDGDIELDTALENYEKGISLIRKCQKSLTNAEQKIVKLSKEDNYQTEQDFS